MDSYIWGVVQDPRIYGMILYAQNQFIYGISKNWKTNQPFGIQILPVELVPLLDTDQGTQYLQENGCNINNQRLRFVRKDVDEELSATFIILAGHDDENKPEEALGAFIYITENKNVMVFTYGHGQEKGPANVCAFENVQKLIDAGY